VAHDLGSTKDGKARLSKSSSASKDISERDSNKVFVNMI
jgi:hypothetical protein